MAGNADKQFQEFAARYLPATRKRGVAAIAKLRKLIPGAHELVYDNYNALVVAFSTSERAGDIICSIAFYPRWVSLFFLRGSDLPDPKGLLAASGKAIKHVVLEGDATLDNPDIQALVHQARDRAPAAKGTGGMIIKSISKKQRPRRPAGDK